MTGETNLDFQRGIRAADGIHDGKDRDGKPIRNWKITCRRFCEAKAKKRKTAAK